jgi:hypothetical protein
MKSFSQEYRNPRLYTTPLIYLMLLLLAGYAQAASLQTSPSFGSDAAGLNGAIRTTDNYLGALQANDLNKAYDLLSTSSKLMVAREQWLQQTRPNGGTRPANSLPVAALPYGATKCKTTDVKIAGDRAQVEFEATYTLPLEVFLLKEGEEWRIDLPATDRETIAAISNALLADLTRPVNGNKVAACASIWQAHNILAPFVISHRVNSVQLEADRASVKVIETAVVRGILHLRRNGALWEINNAPSAVAPLPALAKTAAATAPPVEQKKPAPAEQPLPGPRHWNE